MQKAEKAANNTGLPDNLKAGVENLSGMSMDGVKVHYNSGTPAQLNALAYTQGSNIHVAPGQERHLPHEAWHVVQQKQSRVQPTIQMLSKEEIDYVNEKSKIDDNNKRPTMILELPGSGHYGWEGDKDENQNEQRVFHHEGSPEVWTIAGPVGKRALGGNIDKGSNRINKNVPMGIKLITDFVDKQGGDQEILIFMKSHSRNAVVCTRIAKAINELYKDSNSFYKRNENLGLNNHDSKKVTVEAVFFDPVPGPFHAGKNVENDVSNVGESTLVYSIQHKHWYQKLLYDPQKVLGAKRLIISHRGHKVVLESGVIYEKKLYKGLSLNSLPPGAYISTGEGEKEKPEEINKAEKDNVLFAFGLNDLGVTDPNRKKIIKAVTESFFEH
ncbi:MAG: DUF4157 domain-containing protein [Methanosarcina barkeri]|nr:DUF4157 domain-containing protein [Methanosarcina sp. ERenArc_MAG2]